MKRFRVVDAGNGVLRAEVLEDCALPVSALMCEPTALILDLAEEVGIKPVALDWLDGHALVYGERVSPEE